MTSVLKERWVWIIILALTGVLVVPLMVIILILNLPAELKIVATVAIFICWGVAAAYKDWVKSKREEEEKMEKSKPLT